MTVKDLDDSTFVAAVLQTGISAVIDFWSPTCGPCAGFSRLIETFAERQSTQLKFFKVNVADALETAANYNVRGLPTLLLIKDGRPLASHTGALSMAKLESLLTTWAKS